MLTCEVNKISANNKQIIGNLSFEVSKGDFVLITGRNGSGKSTLLSLIKGDLQHNKNFTIDGSCRWTNSIAQDSITYISQDPDTNLITNEVYSEIFIQGSNNQHIIESVLKQFQINHQFLDKRVIELSGGEQQLLAITCAMMKKSECFILDEPTTMLDNENEKLFISAVNELVRQKKTIIMASHKPELWDNANKRICLDSNLESTTIIPVFVASSHNEENIFRASDIDFYYSKRTQLLTNVAMNLQTGDVLHVRGKNGSGKTTLAKILASILSPQKGRVSLNGTPIKKVKKYLPSSCGFSLQNPNWQLLFSTVRDEIEYCTKHNSDNKIDSLEFIYLLLQESSIDINMDPRELSYGQRKFVSNLSFSNLPTVQIFDEPEIGLDKFSITLFYQFVELRKQLGKISIIISHDSSNIGHFRTKELCL